MKKMLTLLFCFSIFFGSAQVTKSNLVGATLDGDSAIRTIDFVAGDFTGPSDIFNVSVTITWGMVSFSGCPAPDFLGFNDHASFILENPNGVRIPLVYNFYGSNGFGSTPTYTGFTSVNATVTFDDTATALPISIQDPVSGIFKPRYEAGHPTLSSLRCFSPIGTWKLIAIDGAATGDPMCYSGFSIEITPWMAPDVPSVSVNSNLICPGASADITVTSGNLNDSQGWEFSMDSCGGNILDTITGSTLTVNPTDTTTYYVRGQGGCGCDSVTVNVGDTTKPIITCPSDQMVNYSASCDYTLADYISLASSSDNCGSDTVTQFPVSGTIINAATLVTLYTDDRNGNIDSCSFHVIPADIVAPIAVCKDDSSYVKANGNVTVAGIDLDGGSSDSCGIASFVLSRTTFNCIDIGDNTISLIVTDVGGNSSTCSAVLTIIDTMDRSTNTVANICLGDSILLGGGQQTTSGIYYDIVPGAGSCDSVIITALTVDSVVDASVTAGQLTLTANATGAIYQWVDCNTSFSVISGAIDPTFSPTANGNYAVIVTENGCSYRSDCFTISSIGIQEEELSEFVRIYPNPSDGLITIDAVSEIIRYPFEITVTNVLGETILKKMIQSSTTVLDLSEQPAGNYVIGISIDGKIYRSSIIRK